MAQIDLKFIKGNKETLKAMSTTYSLAKSKAGKQTKANKSKKK